MYHLVVSPNEVRTGDIFSFDGETGRLARADDFKRRDEVRYDLLWSLPLDAKKIANYIKTTKSHRYDNDTDFWVVNTRTRQFFEASMNLLDDLERGLAQGADLTHLRQVVKTTANIQYVTKCDPDEVKTFIYGEGVMGELKFEEYLITRGV
jgi:hypothetical protein